MHALQKSQKILKLWREVSLIFERCQRSAITQAKSTKIMEGKKLPVISEGWRFLSLSA